jgi:opacity protein-like surface antigen
MRSLALALAAAAAFAAQSAAAAYPVSGYFSYRDEGGSGAAPRCGARYMEFRGERRFDTGGGVPDYRNLSVTPAGAGRFRIVDEFFTGQIRGQVHYTLRHVDPDRLELVLAAGPVIRLRRCLRP